MPLSSFDWEQRLTLYYAVSQDNSGSLDIGFQVVDAAGQPLRNFGRRPAGDLDANVTGAGEYFAYLDNGYSLLTSKTVATRRCTYR